MSDSPIFWCVPIYRSTNRPNSTIGQVWTLLPLYQYQFLNFVPEDRRSTAMIDLELFYSFFPLCAVYCIIVCILIFFLYYHTADFKNNCWHYWYVARGACFLIDIGSKIRRYKKNCETAVTLFELTVRRHPDKVALVMVDGKSWTFRDLDLYSNTVANCFREQVIITHWFPKLH